VSGRKRGGCGRRGKGWWLVLKLATVVIEGVMKLGGVCKVLVIYVNEMRNMERYCTYLSSWQPSSNRCDFQCVVLERCLYTA
jgi:hypothetical protein